MSKKISIRDYLIYTTLNPECGYYDYITSGFKSLLETIEVVKHGKTSLYHKNKNIIFAYNDDILWMSDDLRIYDDIFNYLITNGEIINSPMEILTQLCVEYFNNENLNIKIPSVNINKWYKIH